MRVYKAGNALEAFARRCRAVSSSPAVGVELAAEELLAMVHRSKELAPVVLLANVPLWNNGLPEAEPKIRALNARLEEIGRSQAVRCYRSTRRSRIRRGLGA